MIKLILFLLTSLFISAQSNYQQEITKHRQELHRKFKDKRTSPFLKKEREKFVSLNYYKIDKSWKYNCHLERINQPDTIIIQTNTDRHPRYITYGKISFTRENKKYELTVYQSLDLLKLEKYKNYLFVPFKDLTNGKETYGSGRYLDLKRNDKDIYTLDFNKAYNPYCVYNYFYSCPIPPKENHLNLKVEAGVKNYY